MAHYSKTLVVDFDDTLAITLNRDWANAKPNILLIEKLNQLFDEGWTIHIVTARGQLSCQGDCEAADRKYRQQIENWLYENKVKYTDLSFQKKLAVYYIDDKGITPEDFIKTFNRIPLKGGMSGSDVYYDEAADAVFKTAKNTASAVAWYEVAKHYVNIPKIHSVIGDTIKMERLNEYKGSVIRILEECRVFRDIEPMHPGLLKHMYVKRCMFRIEEELKDELDMKFLETILQYAAEGTQVTFSHGDMSISNIMSGPSGQTVYFIDPINDPTLLSSWQIDIAKLYMSIGFEFGDEDPRRPYIEKFVELHEMTVDFLKAHEIGHYCRVYPYADADKKKIILEKLKEKIQYFKNLVHQETINHVLTANVPQ